MTMLRPFSLLLVRLPGQCVFGTPQGKVRAISHSLRYLFPASDFSSEDRFAHGAKLNDFEKRKLMRKFSVYDTNGDGFIKPDECDAYMEKLKELYNLKDGDELLYAFKQEFESHWFRLLKFMDEDRDRLLSVDEWMSYYPRVTQTHRAKKYENLPEFLQTIADAIFDLMDGRKDNVIDAEEYREFWGRWEPPPISLEEARQHVAVMTENGKYKLTLERYRDCYADFTWGKKEPGIGKYAMGPIQE